MFGLFLSPPGPPAGPGGGRDFRGHLRQYPALGAPDSALGGRLLGGRLQIGLGAAMATCAALGGEHARWVEELRKKYFEFWKGLEVLAQLPALLRAAPTCGPAKIALRASCVLNAT